MQTQEGIYVTAESSGSAYVKSNILGFCEIFTVDDINGNDISLKSCFGKYLTAEDSTRNYDINVKSIERGWWEMFKVEEKPGGKFSLKTHHDRYVVIGGDQELKGDSEVANERAMFVLHCVEGKFTTYRPIFHNITINRKTIKLKCCYKQQSWVSKL